MFWGQMMEHALGILRNEKISATLLAAMIMGAWWIHGWADDTFVAKEEFTELKETVDTGFEEIRINDASQRVRDLRLGLQIAQATAAPQKEIDRALLRIDRAEAYKSCLVHREPNCYALKDLE